MITYVNGTQIQLSEIYKAFMLGFSDYIIKLDMEEIAFISRFFGPEGNSVKLCHVALSDGQPIGVILGGIREWDGLKTLRCGTLSIAPEFRGTEVSKNLLKLHLKDAIDNNCDRVSLEVLKKNDRAIRFYEKNGYFISYDIRYFKIKVKDLEENSEKIVNPIINLKETDITTLQRHRKSHSEIHINWQSELDYYKDSINERHFEIIYNGEITGLLSLSNGGKINYIWIEPNKRNIGIGRQALKQACKITGIETLNISLTNNAVLEGFLRKLGFEKDSIEQFEMFNFLKRNNI